MNKLVGIILIAFFSLTAVQAQEFKFGVKGGLNKTFGGQITGIQSSSIYTGDTFNAEGEIGFHGGVWTQLSFGRFFIRPEVVYSKLESRFDFPNRPAIYNVDELSVPFLVGFNVWGPLDIYAGPAYKKVIDARMEGTEPLDNPPLIVVQNFPLSAQVGAKVEFGSFGLDVRYDRSLATEEAQTIDIVNSTYGINRATFDDARLHQVIVSLTIKLFDTENAGKRRRKGGSCYF
ncbi:PorT family protein [Antarcticibacterium arcticum]|uniref:PorT family protein n=1 Tax=Antarcticibacterium arcticum TaxID=2585771 RepID=A0A5B8YEJ4_9FLAO|nr:PorT family protein [Antarcticibacterium arcticum]QED36315.1 PorT family protein [Antarcticibacterium arcticum]